MKDTNSDSKLYYAIGEVADLLNVSTSLIRYWEKEFPHLKPKSKTAKGDRRYRQQDIENLKVIHSLVKEKGYTLQGAKDVLTKKKPISKNQEVIQTLQQLKGFLIGIKEALDSNTKAVDEA